jgi:alkanesulfonate monooxygenase SsuD/methylene tetrahydromethanopterin reductase-like flavin-dependent oxidoreductase (luciferase family)
MADTSRAKLAYAGDCTRGNDAVSIPGRLQLGLNLPTWEDQHGRAPRWSDVQALARDAEAAGIDTLWVADHLQPRQHLGFWECWTLLAAVAQVTRRVTLGPHVTCTSFRNPSLVAKMATTLDEVSGGRLLLGLGAGFPEFDTGWQIYGYPTDHVVGRFAEAAEIIARLLHEGNLDFAGTFYQVHGCELHPRGPHPGGPPIWIAGGKPRMLGLAARWADAFNYQPPGATPSDLSGVFARLDDACRAIGRDPATVLHTAYTLISFAEPGSATTGPRARALYGTPEDIAEQLRTFHAAGVRHLTCWIDDGDIDELRSFYPLLTPRGLERFEAVLQALRTSEARANQS